MTTSRTTCSPDGSKNEVDLASEMTIHARDSVPGDATII